MIARWREWTASLTGGAQFVLFAVVVAAVVFVLSALRGHPSVITSLVVGVIVSALVTPVAIARRRALRGIRLVVEVSEALRTGLVPVGVDVAVWTSAVERRRVWSLRFLVGGLVLLAVAAGYVVWAAVVADLRLEHALSAVLFAGGGGWLVVSSLIQLPRIRRLRMLLADLADLAGGGGPRIVEPRRYRLRRS